MNILGSAYVRLRGITNDLEKDIEKALKKPLERVEKGFSDAAGKGLASGVGDADFSDLEARLSSAVQSGINRGFDEADYSLLETAAAVAIYSGVIDGLSNVDFSDVNNRLMRAASSGMSAGVKEGTESADYSVLETAMGIGVLDGLRDGFNSADYSGLEDQIKSATQRGMTEGSDTTTININRVVKDISEGVNEGFASAFRKIDYTGVKGPLESFVESAYAGGAESGKKTIQDSFKGMELMELPISTENAEREIRGLASVADTFDVVIDVDVNADKLRDDLDRALGVYDEEAFRPFMMSAYIDPWEIDRQLETLRDEFESVEIEVGIDVDTSEYQRAEEKLNDLAEDRSTVITTDVDAASAAVSGARISFLTRPRVVAIRAELDKSNFSRVAAEIAAAASGFRLLDQTFRNIWDSLKNLDKNIGTIMKLGGAFTYVGTLITSLVSDAAHLVVELGRIAGAAIPLPGILAGMALGAGAFIAVMKDFNTVLPHVGEMFTDLQDRMSGVFWDKAKQPIEDMINRLFPEFSAGMGAVSLALGDFASNMADSLSTALVGELTTMFGYLQESINITAGYTDEFAGIIATLGRHGSEYLPRLATWFGDISAQFNNFLAQAEADGRLAAWTERGIDNLQALGTTIFNVGRIFYELGTIAEEAGGASLQSVSDALGGIATVMSGEPFRSRLVAVFREAHEAISLINNQSGPAVSQFFENLSYLAQDAMSGMAPAIATAIEEIATALSSNAFSEGFRNMVEGISSGIQSVSQSFGPLGEALGSLGTIIGEMATQFGPILSGALTTASQMFVALEGPIMSVIGFFTSLIDSLGSLAGPVTVAAGLMLLMRSNLASLFTALGANPFAAFTTAVKGGSTALGAFGAAARSALIGTGIGIAIMGITTAIAAFTANTENARARNRELAESFEGLEGAATEASAQLLINMVEMERMSHIIDGIGGGGSWSDGIVNFDDALTGLGYTTGEVAGVLGQGEAAVEAFIAEMYEMHGVNANTDAVAESMREMSATTETARDSAIENAQAHSEYDASLGKLGTTIDATAAAEQNATRAAEAHDQALRDGQAAIDAQVDSLEALTDALFELSGETMSVQDASANFHTTLREAVNDEAALAFAAAGQGLNELGTDFDRTTEAGALFQQNMSGMHDAAEQHVRSLSEAGRSHGEIRTAISGTYDALRQVAESYGMSEEAAAAYVDELMGMPEEQFVEMHLETDQAYMDLNDLRVMINRETGEITIDGDTYPAETSLADALDLVADSEGMVSINGNPFPAEMSLNEFLSLAEVEDAMVDVDADTSGAEGQVSEFRGSPLLMSMAGIPITAETEQAEVSVSEFRGSPLLMSMAGIPITAETEQAELSVSGFRAGPLVSSLAGIPISANTETASAQVSAFRGGPLFNAFTSIPVTSNTSAATSNAAAATTTISKSSGTITVNANTQPSLIGLAGVVGATMGTVATMRISANAGLATSILTRMISAVGATVATMRYNANPAMASRQLVSLVTAVRATTSTMRINANISGARLSLTRMIGAVQGTIATMRIAASTASANASLNALINRATATRTMTIRAVTVQANEDGGLYPAQRYAVGGIRSGENRVAQISRTGVTRIWSEPETHGESYIPLARTKRRRSLSILRQTANLMGYDIAPIPGRTLRQFAAGGLISSSRTTSTSSTTTAAAVATGTTVNNHFNITTTNDMDVDDLAREVSRIITFKKL